MVLATAMPICQSSVPTRPLCALNRSSWQEPNRRTVFEMNAPTGGGECLYLYGIVDAHIDLRLGHIGVAGAEVYTIPYREFSAIVHDCPPKPYESRDGRVVQRWIKAHGNVLDVFAKKLEDVIPFQFDTIIKPQSHTTSRLALGRWISKECQNLRKKMEKIRGKREYGIQIFYVPSSVTKKIVSESMGIEKIVKDAKPNPEGIAYIRRLEFESMVRKKLEATVASQYKDFYDKIRREVDEIRIGGTRRIGSNRAMLMNLSVLADDEEARALGSLLDKIGKEGFPVRFTGPWPPYSFV